MLLVARAAQSAAIDGEEEEDQPGLSPPFNRSRIVSAPDEASSYGRAARYPRPAATLFAVEDRVIEIMATVGFAIANIPD